jgi:hypothetical protein
MFLCLHPPAYRITNKFSQFKAVIKVLEDIRGTKCTRTSSVHSPHTCLGGEGGKVFAKVAKPGHIKERPPSTQRKLRPRERSRNALGLLNSKAYLECAEDRGRQAYQKKKKKKEGAHRIWRNMFHTDIQCAESAIFRGAREYTNSALSSFSADP